MTNTVQARTPGQVDAQVSSKPLNQTWLRKLAGRYVQKKKKLFHLSNSSVAVEPHLV